MITAETPKGFWLGKRLGGGKGQCSSGQGGPSNTPERDLCGGERFTVEETRVGEVKGGILPKNVH